MAIRHRAIVRPTAACLSAALCLASWGPAATAALASEIRAASTQTSPLSPRAALAPLGLWSPAAGGALAPASQAPLSGSIPSLQAPVLTANAAASAGPTLAQSAMPGPASLLAAPAPPEDRQLPRTEARAFRPGPASVAAVLPGGVSAASLDRIDPASLAMPESAAKTPASSKSWAEDSFAYLKGERGGLETAGSVEAQAPSPARPSGLKPPSRFRAKGLVLSAGGAVAALGAIFAPGRVGSSPGGAVSALEGSAQPAGAPFALDVSGVGAALGQAGYIVGNFLGAIFSLPQVYKTFEDGHAKGTPVWRACVLAAANLALGLVSAPIAGKWFWGVQNVFGAVTMLAVIPIGAWLARKRASSSARFAREQAPGPRPWAQRLASLYRDPSMRSTLAVGTLGFLLSAGLYAAAAAAVPALLAPLGAATIASLLLGIQAVSGGMYFLLFVPDVLSVLRGKAPAGFTPGVSLSFFLASFGFVAWTAQMALESPSGSSGRQQFLIYLALNAAYAVVSFASWVITRRQAKTTSFR